MGCGASKVSEIPSPVRDTAPVDQAQAKPVEINVVKIQEEIAEVNNYSVIFPCPYHGFFLSLDTAFAPTSFPADSMTKYIMATLNNYSIMTLRALAFQIAICIPLAISFYSYLSLFHELITLICCY